MLTISKGITMQERERTPALAYRPDIDGLRAFAVLSVVFYHAFPNTLKGGFIGVDVFFVISGYLIGSIIMSDLEQNKFSFLNFYARRIRRIFPALIVVLSSALLFGWLTLLPDEYKSLGKHAFGGAAFIDNFLLWQESGYFDVSSKLKPLLHLWSLGIEEQFYIVFPLLLYLTYKKFHNFYFIISFFLIFSFLDNIYVSDIDRNIDFYSPLTRFWELLLGAFWASLVRKRFARRFYLIFDKFFAQIIFRNHVKNNGQSLSLLFFILGFSLLFISLLVCRSENCWPAWKALLPVFGSLFIILAGPINICSKYIFCNKISIFLGKISYPLFLWHWVLLSYLFIIYGTESRLRYYKILIMLLSIILSIITYYYIEKPIRFSQKYYKFSNYILIFFIMLISVFGIIIYMKDGITSYNKSYSLIANQLQPFQIHDKEAFSKFPELPNDNHTHVKFTNNGCVQTLAILGDSHALSGYYGLKSISKKIGYNIISISRDSSAMPIISLLLDDSNLNKKISLKILDFICQKKEIKHVFIICRGPWVYEDYKKNNMDFKVLAQKFSNDEIFLLSMKQYTNILIESGKFVHLIQDNPRLPEDIRFYLPRRLGQNFRDSGINYRYVEKLQSNYINLISRIEGVDVIRTLNLFCPKNKNCIVANELKEPLYKDKDHLSIAGSNFLANKILYDYIKNF